MMWYDVSFAKSSKVNLSVDVSLHLISAHMRVIFHDQYTLISYSIIWDHIVGKEGYLIECYLVLLAI